MLVTFVDHNLLLRMATFGMISTIPFSASSLYINLPLSLPRDPSHVMANW